MIPSSTLTTTQTGTIPGRTTLMTIDQEHMPHIMELLTRAYSDIIAAILREYSANAWDSHVASGKTDVPIQVRTPNKFHPFLEIEDFGQGMSIDFVENEFSKYGASTKRTNNQEAGAFGIGGKSALAYTDQFTMVTIKDGVKAEFVIYRNENGAAQITLVREEPTTQGNGTLVSIPAKQNEDFDAKVDWFFKFWKPGTVLVDGEPPRQVRAEKLDEGVFYTPEGNNSYVVMGNIPYRVMHPTKYIPGHFANFAFIIDVPIGSVSITPNREDLEYGDEGTIETLKRVGKVFEEKMLAKIKKEITDQPDHYSAWERWHKWTQVIGNDYLKDMTYKGDKFVTYIEAAGYEWASRRYRNGRSIQRLGNRGKYIGNQYVYGPYVDIKELKHVIVQDKTTPTPWSEPTSYERQKVRWFFQEKNESPGTVFFLDEVPVSPWVEGLKVYEWADVKKAKNPNYVPKQRQTGGGKVQIFGGSVAYAYWNPIDMDDLPDDETLVLITPYDADHYLDKNKLAGALSENGLTPTIIRLGENRWTKFKREHPDTVTLKEYLQDQVRIQRAAIPKVSWLMKKLPYQQTRMLAGMDPSLISDPDLADLVTQVRKHKHTYENDFARIRRLVTCMQGLSVDLDNNNDDEYDNPLDRYPLVAGLDYLPSGEALDDVYYYINKKFKDKK